VWTFATAEQPLVLFLDDLHRADPASLSLLEMLLADGERGHLLVLGAYRDREVGPTHPFVKTRATIAQAGTPVRELGLMPLGLPEVTATLAAGSRARGKMGGALAEIPRCSRILRTIAGTVITDSSRRRPWHRVQASTSTSKVRRSSLAQSTRGDVASSRPPSR